MFMKSLSRFDGCGVEFIDENGGGAATKSAPEEELSARRSRSLHTRRRNRDCHAD